MQYLNRKYVIINTNDLDKVDFNQVLEDSKNTVRKSIDGTLSILKYESNQPTNLQNINSVSKEYSHSEILDLLITSDWQDNKME